MSETAISEAFDATKLFFQNRRERMKYLNRQMASIDYKSGMQWAEARGEARGEANGKRHEQRRFSRLVLLLDDAGRSGEIVKAASNPELLNQLYREFGLD